MHKVNPVIISVPSMVACPDMAQRGGAYTNDGSPVDLRRKWFGLQLMEYLNFIEHSQEKEGVPKRGLQNSMSRIHHRFFFFF